MFPSPLISGINKTTVKNEDGPFSQPCTFKKGEFYLQCLFKRILELRAFKSRRYFRLFSLWSFSLKSKLYPVNSIWPWCTWGHWSAELWQGQVVAVSSTTETQVHGARCPALARWLLLQTSSLEDMARHLKVWLPLISAGAGCLGQSCFGRRSKTGA